MRKVRDYDAELKALEERARTIKARRTEQLGVLVTATGADTLDMETLAGALLDAVASKNAEAKEVWRAKGSAFFQRRGRKGSRTAGCNSDGGNAQPGADPASGSGAASG
ncbi:Conjugal transfer protein TraD [Sphingomonas sp. OV641]|uniref:conjugal transfer protein TraD n=1 Tax=Sphingomonas sp. OV641 TaxID=1881068 RepID=UPI0008ADA03E|nr:conjugal transfer protein TraD [Sphingomonas sp. OV641]SEK03084.1 Conjugal transfer protein TraD [Sphingomonas sp. OV641]